MEISGLKYFVAIYSRITWYSLYIISCLHCIFLFFVVFFLVTNMYGCLFDNKSIIIINNSLFSSVFILIVGSSNTVPSPVAFTAVLTHDVTLGPLQTLEYDKVITNIGNAYDSRHGHFTAPVKGIYMFSATVCDRVAFLRTEMVRNGVQLVAMYGDDADSASHTIMLLLEQNDMVWVRHSNESTSTAHAGSNRYYTSFSGALMTCLQ